MLFVTATLAVSWSMFLGISHIPKYNDNLDYEKYFREQEAIWQARNETVLAEDSRRKAREAAQLNQVSLTHGVTALSLTVLGIVSGGLGLAIRVLYGARKSLRPGFAKALATACTTVATILLAGLTFGGIAYIVAMLFVIAFDD